MDFHITYRSLVTGIFIFHVHTSVASNSISNASRITKNTWSYRKYLKGGASLKFSAFLCKNHATISSIKLDNMGIRWLFCFLLSTPPHCFFLWCKITMKHFYAKLNIKFFSYFLWYCVSLSNEIYLLLTNLLQRKVTFLVNIDFLFSWY